MRISSRGKRTGQNRGILLMDCLMYIALFFLISVVGFRLFYSCWDNAKAFRRNTGQVADAVKTGERWREDIRAATAPLRAENSAEGEVLRIPQRGGEVDYRFATASLWRRNGAQGDWIEVLPEVKSSRMQADQRRQITAWRWELELATRRKGARVTPLFTFEAVPNALLKP